MEARGGGKTAQVDDQSMPDGTTDDQSTETHPPTDEGTGNPDGSGPSSEPGEPGDDDGLGDRRVPVDLSDPDKDAVLKRLESGEFTLDGADGKTFFAMVIKDVQMGFFADPIYGGNRDMVAWKMIGYPGSRYIVRSVRASISYPWTHCAKTPSAVMRSRAAR